MVSEMVNMDNEKILEKKFVYTYAEFMNSPTDERYEVIDGILYNMTPAPTPRHQHIITQLATDFGTYFRKSKKCQVFVAQIDVCLSEGTKDPTQIYEWVQPDLVVVCDQTKIDQQKIIGVPDIVIEVLSPSTAKKDRKIKFNRYQLARIPQYWIIDPVHESVEVYHLHDKKYELQQIYFKDDVLTIDLFPSLHIDLDNIFNEW